MIYVFTTYTSGSTGRRVHGNQQFCRDCVEATGRYL